MRTTSCLALRYPRLATSLFASLGLLLVSCSSVELSSRLDPNAGASAAGECVAEGEGCLRQFGYPIGGEKSVELRGDFATDGWERGIPLVIDGGQWTTTLSLPNGTVVHYKFLVDGTTWVTDPNNPNTESDGVGSENSVLTTTCEVCTEEDGAGGRGERGGSNAATSFDWRSAVLYFVFVDRFNNGDISNDKSISSVESEANYQGGDYAGLIQKIQEGYFTELGVNALWLTVPMNNPNVSGVGSDGHLYSAYHGYWPTELDKVEEHFGTMDELKEVVTVAHARGIKILFDYAMNHVHEDSPVYEAHPEWFWPLDYEGAECVCGEGCDWNDSYEQKRCWFRNYLPDWNFQNEEARAASVDNALWWIKETGIDGFRLDAVKHIETQWITDLRERVTEEIEPETGEHFYMVGETFEASNRDFIAQYVDSSLLDGQFDFPLRGVLVDTVLRRDGSLYDLDDFLATNDAYYDGIMSTFLGNHDIARIINTALDSPWDAWDNGGTDNWENPPQLPSTNSAFERLALGFTLLFTMKGIPLIYYGDEVGMPGAGDPDNRRFMQWDGYSEGQTFLKGRIASLGAIRQAHPALWKGTRTTLSLTDDTYAYAMSIDSDTVYVGFNRSDSDAAVTGFPEAGTDLLTHESVAGPSIMLAPRTAVVVVRQ